MSKNHFKIRVTDKKTGKVVSYFKLEDNDRFVYDLFTGYQDMNGEDIYTNDKIECYYDGYNWGNTKEIGTISKKITEIDFMAIDDRNTAFPLILMDQMLKLSEEKE